MVEVKVEIAILSALAFFITGCWHFDRIIATPVVTEVPGQFVTNITIVPLPSGHWQTNYNIATLTKTNWIKNELTFDTVEAAGGLVPVYGSMAVAIFGLFGTAYTAWLNKRSKRAHVATIVGVEQFRDGLHQSGEVGSKLDVELKQILVGAHVAAGVVPLVAKLVDANTVPRAEKPIAEVKKVLAGSP